MSTFTEHYSLIMPSSEDYYDVQDFNENTEALDGLLYEQERAIADVGEKVDGVAEKIGGPGDEGEDTLFGCLAGRQKGEVFYFPSRTVVQESITEKALGTADTSFTAFVLMSAFFAKHDGMVCISYSATQSSGSSRFIIAGDLMSPSLMNLSPLSTVTYVGLLGNNCVDWREGGNNIMLPVEKGKTYYIFLYCVGTVNMTLKSFQLCYEEKEVE